MKFFYDEGADAVYIRFDDAQIIDSNEVEPGVILDYDANSRLVGIEILGTSKHITPASLKHMEFKVG